MFSFPCCCLHPSLSAAVLSVSITLCIVRMLVCASASVCRGGGWGWGEVGGGLRIVCMDKILRFTNTLLLRIVHCSFTIVSFPVYLHYCVAKYSLILV